jgi:hypothetical protein
VFEARYVSIGGWHPRRFRDVRLRTHGRCGISPRLQDYRLKREALCHVVQPIYIKRKYLSILHLYQSGEIEFAHLADSRADAGTDPSACTSFRSRRVQRGRPQRLLRNRETYAQTVSS